VSKSSRCQSIPIRSNRFHVRRVSLPDFRSRATHTRLIISQLNPMLMYNEEITIKRLCRRAAEVNSLGHQRIRPARWTAAEHRVVRYAALNSHRRVSSTVGECSRRSCLRSTEPVCSSSTLSDPHPVVVSEHLADWPRLAPKCRNLPCEKLFISFVARVFRRWQQTQYCGRRRARRGTDVWTARASAAAIARSP
jgi:hypothetical protein